MNWTKWKSKIQSIDVASAIGSIKENTSSAVSFVRNISSSEPQQYIEAEQLGIYYISSNVLAMGYPSSESLFSGTKNATLNKLGKFVSDSLANKIALYLNKYHSARYMIWNLSEKSYATQIFNDQVIEFRFPGYPSPPLQQLFELLSSIDNWLSSNDENVAIIHCQTGKGRTVTVISAYLAWSKYHNFTPAKALLHCVKMMNGTIKNMTIPSQTRYLAYLTKILINKQTPKQQPLMIQRVILHKIPVFEINHQTYYVKKTKSKSIQSSSSKDHNSPSLLNMNDNNNNNNKNDKTPHKEAQFTIGSIDDEEEEEEEEEDIEEQELGQNVQNIAAEDTKKEAHETKAEETGAEEEEKEKKVVSRSGVRAYIQIFKNAKLIFSSRRKNSTLKFYDVNEGHIKFEVNQSICGDVLVRIRHLCSNGRDKISVCRFAFHTGYLDSNRVIRFKKTQLDGAWNSNKFNKDFWIDLLIGNNEIETTQQNKRENDLFWANICKQFAATRGIRHSATPLDAIDESKDRFSIIDEEDDKEWRERLTQWNLSAYIADFERESLFIVDEWKTLTKTDLIKIGLSQVDAQIFLNLNDNPQNVANQLKNDLQNIQNKMTQNDENVANILNEMDHSSKEVIDTMHTMIDDNNENDDDTKKADGDDDDDEVPTTNAEEAPQSPQSMENTFGDLEQFADGLDLENVQVDSDTEQNFEMLLEELNDNNDDNAADTSTNKEKDTNVDLP